MEKIDWRGYSMVKKIKHMYIRFDRIHERDGWTDTHDEIGRACIASRDKNRRATDHYSDWYTGR